MKNDAMTDALIRDEIALTKVLEEYAGSRKKGDDYNPPVNNNLQTKENQAKVKNHDESDVVWLGC